MYKVGDKVKLVIDLPDSYECQDSQTGHIDHVEHTIKVRKDDIGVIVLYIKVRAPRKYMTSYPIFHGNNIIRYEEKSIIIADKIIGVAFSEDSISKGVYDRLCDIDDFKKVSNNHKVGNKQTKPKVVKKAIKAVNIINNMDFTKIVSNHVKV